MLISQEGRGHCMHVTNLRKQLSIPGSLSDALKIYLGIRYGGSSRACSDGVRVLNIFISEVAHSDLGIVSCSPRGYLGLEIM